jgi:uncharacterized RDD family membrane protein YckC
MPATHRTITAVFLLSLVGWHFLPIDSIGFSCHTSSDGIDVSAGTHPAVLVWAALVICFYVFLLKKRISTNVVGNAGLFRRVLAYLIDFPLVVVTTSCVTAIIPLAAEAHRVGHFEWSVQRDYLVSSDLGVILPLSLLSLVELFFYFVYPLTRGKQTIGDYIMRIKVTPRFGNEGRFTWGAAIERVFYSAAGLMLWPYTVWKKLDRNGQTWYDRKTDSTVVLVDYKRGDADIAT